MYKDCDISYDATIIEALKKMDLVGRKLLIIHKFNKFIGLISIGDIQRALINSIPLNTTIIEILRKNFRVAKVDDSKDFIRQMMLEFRMELCPVISETNEIVDVCYWEDVFNDQQILPKEKFNIPVVIMAGGFGTRLKPITNVLPKPLLPIPNKTILEEICCRFNNFGCDKFYISLNYKADLIKYYIDSLRLPYNIEFFIEDTPCGTAGSINLLNGTITETFFVTNCDIIIDQDYSEILNYHRNNNNDITIIAALKTIQIEYGIIETTKFGRLRSFIEKPEYTYKINSGMYILEPSLIKEIPSNHVYHITDLINKVINDGGNVGVFPVSEKSWKDYGTVAEYLKLLI